MKNKRPFAVLAIVFISVVAFSSPIRVVNKMKGGVFPIVADSKACTIYVDDADAEVVGLSANLFSKDVMLVTDAKPYVSKARDINSGSLPVVFGTLGKSSLIDKLASVGKIDVKKVKGMWETFGIAVVCRAIVRTKSVQTC